MNVVSTSPSGTEILYALGIEPVAVSSACDYPPAVEGTPRIDSSRIGIGSSRERHGQVMEIDGRIHDVDVRRLQAAEPELVITQTVCGVCAVDTHAIDAALEGFDTDPAVVGLQARQLDDVFDCIRTVGEATHRDAEAAALIAALRARLERIAELTAPIQRRPRIAVIEWMDPVHIAANWVPELVDIAGGSYGLAEPGKRSRTTPWDEIVKYDPEVLVIAPCSYPVDRTANRLEELASRSGWESLSAVRDGRVYALDGSSYLTRWSPRLVDATERLAAVLQPTVCGPIPDDVRRLESSVTSS